MRRQWPGWPTSTARSSSMTLDREPCLTPNGSDCCTSRRRTNDWRLAPMSSRSVATSSSGDRKPVSWSAAPTSIERLRRDPLARAMRPDKAILAAVAATLGLYRAGVAATEIPVWQRIATPADELKERAGWISQMCAAFFAPRAGVEVVELASPIGGGSLPGSDGPVLGDQGAIPICDGCGCGAAPRRPIDPGTSQRRRGRLRSSDGRPWCRRGHRPADRGTLSDRRMTVVVGTAGHIDHGKTTLLRALTGIDADRLPEERRRGMTIDVGYRAPRPRRRIDDRLRRRARTRQAGRATCSSGPARSMPRCSSWPRTTGRARKRSSTSRCSTRSGSRRRWRS